MLSTLSHGSTVPFDSPLLNVYKTLEFIYSKDTVPIFKCMGEGSSDVQLVLTVEENISRQEGPWTKPEVEQAGDRAELQSFLQEGQLS